MDALGVLGAAWPAGRCWQRATRRRKVRALQEALLAKARLQSFATPPLQRAVCLLRRSQAAPPAPLFRSMYLSPLPCAAEVDEELAPSAHERRQHRLQEKIQ